MTSKILITIGGGCYFSSHMSLLSFDLDNEQFDIAFSKENNIYGESTKGFLGLVESPLGYLITSEAQIHILSKSLLSSQSFTYKFLNDAHYTHWSDYHNKYFVANTGLDTIEVLDKDMRPNKSIHLLQQKDLFRILAQTASSIKQKIFPRDCSLTINPTLEDIRYKKLSKKIILPGLQKYFLPALFRARSIDFRFAFMRPHVVHPNYICEFDDDILVTLKNPGEVRSIYSKQILLKGLKGPHDGCLRNNTYLLTESSNGIVSWADNIHRSTDLKSANFKRVQVCDPKKGFLRGVELISDEHLLVAVSKRREVQDDQPAWLALINKKIGFVEKKYEIPYELGTNPFSILKID
ncbi:hypothetical protein [Synechococcus sp. N5]|uniref:hypothetical protein n=1 Tax=Synechococcus sp. N5 TaxID=2575515 RepID=UPI0010BDAACE|nr:hypothetical protein [Synechococcus sp. N5]